MNTYIIEGGHPLDGSVRIHRAENSVLPILVACLLALGECVIHNRPKLPDVVAPLDILQRLGCRVEWQGDAVVVDVSASTGRGVPDTLMREMHSSVIFPGAILGRMGRAELCVPDGCELGPQPIDLHLGAIRGLDGRITGDGGGLRVEEVLQGADLMFSLPSVEVTENAMPAAVCAAGTTTITNAVRELEIANLQGFLRIIRAKMHEAGSSVITVENGVPLHDGSYAVMGGRIAAAAYPAAVASVDNMVEVTGTDYRHPSAVNAVLREAGCNVQNGAKPTRLHQGGPLQEVRSVRTAPYPGFPTDTQTPFMAAPVWGKSYTAFVGNASESRYRHVDEPSRMGADVRVEGRVAVMYGMPWLHGTQVRATDLRGRVVLMVAVLKAEGCNGLTSVHRTDRGYQSLEGDLRCLGVEIRRTQGFS